MFQSQGVKCVPYLPEIIPTYLSTIKTCDPSIKEVHVVFGRRINFTIKILKNQNRMSNQNQIFMKLA